MADADFLPIDTLRCRQDDKRAENSEMAVMWKLLYGSSKITVLYTYILLAANGSHHREGGRTNTAHAKTGETTCVTSHVEYYQVIGHHNHEQQRQENLAHG